MSNKPKRRHPSRTCRSGPVIVSTYNKVAVSCRCASCGHSWIPRKRKHRGNALCAAIERKMVKHWYTDKLKKKG